MACARWRLSFADCDVIVTFSPAVTHGEAHAMIPGAVAAEPALEPPEPAASCGTCTHRTVFGNCAIPVEAALAPKFTLIEHPIGGAGCAVHAPKPNPIDARLVDLLARGAIDTGDAALCRQRYDTDPSVWDVLLNACDAAAGRVSP